MWMWTVELGSVKIPLATYGALADSILTVSAVTIVYYHNVNC